MGMNNNYPKNKIMKENEIVIYQPNNSTPLKVRIENETVWLTQQQLADLFQSSRTNIVEHIKHIYEEGELDVNATCRKIRQVQNEGNRSVTRELPFYNLDLIISLGYRIKSHIATRFRQWATSVLKEYMLRGYAINQRIERLEYRVFEHDKQIETLVREALPPKQGIFYDGQVFDAYTFVSNLIKSAKKSIVLIDNYIDENVLLLLSKRANDVSLVIYTQNYSQQLKLDLEKHNAQYPAITIHPFSRSHDRFLIIDDDTYHIGASLKDLGKKWFAFSKMELKISCDQLFSQR
jgi:biotin operon repressor